MNFALQARGEIALYRALQDIDSCSAWNHYRQALEFAAKAYDMGQAHSPLLQGEIGFSKNLVHEARLTREKNDPLKSDFATWLQPLIAAIPECNLNALASYFDEMSLDDWCNAGDRASAIDSAFKYQGVRHAAQLAFGPLWSQTEEAVRQNALKFCNEAKGRAELDDVCKFIRRYLDIGVHAAIFATGERALGKSGSASYWLSYVFGIQDESMVEGNHP